MSLVDYADSSDEDEPKTPAAAAAAEDEQVKENPEKRPRFEPPATAPFASAPPAVHRVSTSFGPPSNQQKGIVPNESPALKLPDASLLLNSPTTAPSHQFNSSDHSSRVAAAMAENAARKRELTGSSASYPRSKVPKGALPHSKTVPDTVTGRLLPPQLSGRSNVVTEDISKLFVRKTTGSPAE